VTQTPHLGRRVLVVGLAVVVLVLVLVNTFVFLELRAGVDRSLQDLLRERAGLAQSEATRLPPHQLAERLQELGLRAVVHAPDGNVYRANPVSPNLGTNLPPGPDDPDTISHRVPLPGGGEVEVFARTSGRDLALRQLLALQVGGSVAGLLVAGVLLRYVSTVALRPLAHITAAATRTAQGREGERLRPDRPNTELGRMATAYDTMLDALETAVREAREAEEKSALLAAVVEGTADAVVTEDLDGWILSWNQRAEELYGYPAAEVLGRPAWLIIPDSRRAETAELLGKVRAGELVSGYETQRLTRQGVLLDVSVTISPVRDSEGRVIAASSIARDLTEQRRMAASLRKALEDLQVAADEARRSEETTRRFLADAAHQLRTPIAGIRACAETLLLGGSPEDRDRLLATMVRETSRAGRLIAALLQMARLDQGEAFPDAEVDVVAVVADEVDRVDLLAPALDVTLDAGEGTEGRWLLHGSALREIVSNLLDNARRHARTRIDVLVQRRGDVLEIRVRDDGPGVAPENRERIFERFVSMDGLGGSGLGLAVALGSARAMGGDVRYDAGFVVTVPAEPSGIDAAGDGVAAGSSTR
jgi:PAS domain S-box-containing protein